MLEHQFSAEQIVLYLQGSQFPIEDAVRTQADLVAKCMLYSLKEKYHREHMCRALVCLFAYAPAQSRENAWAIMQRITFSHLLELPNVIKQNKENSHRLRHALVSKIAHSSLADVFRAYFLATSDYRKLFTYFFLPTELFDDQPIMNENYIRAYKLSQYSIHEVFQQMNISKVQLVRDFHLPLERVMPLFENKDEGIALAQHLSSDTFFRHGRWFRSLIGDEEYEKIGIKKGKDVKDPTSFVAIQKHLEETNSITPTLVKAMQERMQKYYDDLMKNAHIDRIALIVDISSSMHSAIRITQQLNNVFSKMVKITDMIAFNADAYRISTDELQNLQPNGMTCIGSSIIALYKCFEMRKTDIPQAIIMVTDMGENVSPSINDSLKLMEPYQNPPLVILLCGEKHRFQSKYPHAVIELDDFHPTLVQTIMQRIVQATATVAVHEREITKVIKVRRPIAEIINEVRLIPRPKETLQKGYLRNLLLQSVQPKAVTQTIIPVQSKNGIVQQIGQLFAASNKISDSDVAATLNLEMSELWSRLPQWASDYGFAIEGSEIIFQSSTMQSFLAALETYCPECHAFTSSDHIICDQCGFHLIDD